MEDLRRLNPCEEGIEFAGRRASVADAWDACDRADWMIWLLERTGRLDKPTAVRYAVEYAEHFLGHYEAKYPDDGRPRRAIAAVRAYLLDPSEPNRAAAQAAARAAQDAHCGAYATWLAAAGLASLAGFTGLPCDVDYSAHAAFIAALVAHAASSANVAEAVAVAGYLAAPFTDPAERQ